MTGSKKTGSAATHSSPLVGEVRWGVRGLAARRPEAANNNFFRALLPSARILVGEGAGAVASAVPHRRARPEARTFPRLLSSAAPVLLLAACATQAASGVAPGAPGFLHGLWHGIIFPVAWLLSLFMPDVSVYAVPNNGGWYDFGYFLGIVVFGVGARRTHTVYRDRVVVRREPV